ncbi:MAG: helix-turn-helix domain-containing protein [Streptococcaceae bacterium]|nr:helix-turn-helix domain-containing protein [Streptococcaceae bacterium]
MEISIFLKESRKKKGYSQKTVAKMLNISRQAVSSWERGKTHPDLERLISLSEIYDVSLNLLKRKNSSLD